MAIAISLGTITLKSGLCEFASGKGTTKAPRASGYGYDDIKLNNTDYAFGMNFSNYSTGIDFTEVDHAELDYKLPDETEHLFDGVLKLVVRSSASGILNVYPISQMMSQYGTVRCRFKLIDSAGAILASGTFNYTIVNRGAVVVYRKLDLWRHGIPPRLHVSQGDTNFGMRFMIYSSRGEISFVRNNDVPYYTELRATLPNQIEIVIPGELLNRELFPFYRENKGTISNANSPNSYAYFAWFKPTEELTAVVGTVIFEVVLKELSSFNIINGAYQFTGNELRTSNAELIVEPPA